MIEAKQFRIMSVVVVAIAAAMLLNTVFLPSAISQVSTGRKLTLFPPHLTQPISNIEVDGDYAYLGVGDHMVILDVSDPLAPIELGETGRLLAPYGSWKEDYQCRGSVSEVAVSGSFAYVAADTGGIQIVDVSDPRYPEVVDSVGSFGSIGITIEESVLVEAQDICSIYSRSGYVRLYEVTDPVGPIEIGSVHHAGFSSGPNQIIVWGAHVYAAAANGSTLEIISVDDPSEHYSYGQFDWPNLPDGFTPISLIAHEHYLYVSANAWPEDPLLAIFDITDPINPIWVNSPDVDAGTSMVIESNKLYISNGSTIDVYELTDPVNPVFMFSHTLDRLITDIDVQDNCIYAGAYPSGFYTFCTNDPVVTLTPSLTPTSTPSLTPTATPSPSPTAETERRLYLPLIHGYGS